MPTTATKTDGVRNPLTTLLAWLGAHRDGFLVSGAVLYGLGYLVWTYNAWRNHLGQLPAAEFQYLIAGIIPGVLICLAWAGVAFSPGIRDKTIAIFEEYGFLRVPIVILYGAVFLAGYIAEKTWGWKDGEISRYSLPFAVVVMYLLLVTNDTWKNWRPLLVFYRYWLPFLFCWYCLLIYVDLYPRLPQVLGGPQPRCAYVDLEQQQIASSTLSALALANSADSSVNSAPKVVRTKKLDVYFSSSDYLLVRVASDTGTTGSTKPENEPLYELRKEIIRVVQWCR